MHRCRVCGRGPVEWAHLVPRRYDKEFGYKIPADAIVPLCTEHHRAFDAGRLDLIPYLSKAEQAFAVSVLGIVRALNRLGGSNS